MFNLTLFGTGTHGYFQHVVFFVAAEQGEVGGSCKMSKRNRNVASILFKYELMYVTKAGDAFCVEVEDFFSRKKEGEDTS